MSLSIKQTRSFDRDLDRMENRGEELPRLFHVIEILTSGKRLEARYKDHKLTGNWVGRRECHVKPDWLLIYRIEKNTLILERTGSHSDLF
ncbi:MAG: type II toxin-antitoxin system YafQ family toxin [Alphaproteobacteria bacterium]|nr:type II toxin-antitoxin system YafQ family toxin [Alphaproteobacteria bacterium]